MVYRGHVRNGRIELDEETSLPEGAEVQVSLLPEPAGKDELPTLYERLKGFVGVVDDLPSDAARNVDHYLYGHPKR